MSIKNTNFPGDVTVGRELTAGGRSDFKGNSKFHHNVRVEGWLDAPNIKGPCKGLYASVETLNEAYPRPMPGWYALVGDTLPAAVYRAEGGKWVATGQVAGDVKFYPDEIEKDIEGLDDRTGDIEVFLSSGIIIPGSVQYSADSDTLSLVYRVSRPDGTETEIAVEVPEATAGTPGAMSAADKTLMDYYENSRSIYLEGQNSGVNHSADSVVLGNTYGGSLDDLEVNEVGIKAATQEEAGVMSAADKTKLDNIPADIEDKVLNTIPFDGLDLTDAELRTSLIRASKPTRFIVTYESSIWGVCNVGVLETFSDDMRHQLTEVFTTHYILNDDGSNRGHNDKTIYTYFRSYKIGGALDVPANTWSAWKLISTSDDREGFINNFSLIGKNVEQLQKEGESIKDSIDKLVIGEVPSLSKEEIDKLVKE